MKRWRDDGSKGGSEHQVYFEEAKHSWVKRNTLNFHDGSISAYLERLVAHKLAFPDTAPKFIGLTFSGGMLFPMIEQPDVQGSMPTLEQIDAALESIEFELFYETGQGMRKAHELATAAGLNPPPLPAAKRIGYYLRDEGIWLEDVHEENARIAPNGALRVFDPVMYYVGEVGI